ncbi:DUF2798 domain-containing protein [Vogesella oryzae]|uniref:DUF2798 domain-containing protein n=1 Tax=Vogesella oryzae TaxID=1735285 RepID=UPI00158261C7|nr:DUF2798 domain-containing protein [Vogesella oryzae]
MPAPLRLRLLFALLMSCLMSLLMTAWVTWLNLGAGPAYFAHWGRAFVAAWPAAFTAVLLLAPAVQRLSLKLVGGLPAARV